MKKALLSLIATFSFVAAVSANEMSLPYGVVAIYDGTGGDVSNYYLILSDNEAANYNHLSSTIDINKGFVVTRLRSGISFM